MNRQTITLCYKKVIDSASQHAWDKLVFEDTYMEFKMQSQLYNAEKKYQTFKELMQHVPNADKLHFLVSAAAVNYIKQLGDRIPDLTDMVGKRFLPFQHFQFEIINSHTSNKAAHSIAIYFYSDPLIWHHTVGDCLLLSDKKSSLPAETITHLFQLKPFVNIHSIQNAGL
ncbi:MAG: hypothetical protein QM802_09465 [Agriterribacter sp.]